MGILDRYLFSLLSCHCWARLDVCLFRFGAFVDYSVDAILLKRATAADTEFVHRLLRDYLALRDLQPQLDDARLETAWLRFEASAFKGNQQSACWPSSSATRMSGCARQALPRCV